MIENPLYSDFDISQVIKEMDKTGVACVPNFLNPMFRGWLLHELCFMDLVPDVAQKGKYGVTQNFSFTRLFHPASMFEGLKRTFGRFLNKKLQLHEPYPVSEPLDFNEMTVQTYQPCYVGISAHRDGVSFINIIAVFILEGKGDFMVCSDRDGNNSLPIRNEPGDLLLMRAPGFLGKDIQPFHHVNNITEKRTTLALRHGIKIPPKPSKDYRLTEI
jgi:hypothetical protein